MKREGEYHLKSCELYLTLVLCCGNKNLNTYNNIQMFYPCSPIEKRKELSLDMVPSLACE